MKIAKTFATIVAGVVTALSALIMPQASAEATTLNQGDTIENSYGGTCTVGYINHWDNTAYTAKHCLSDDKNFYKDGNYVGTAYYDDPIDPAFIPRNVSDSARIYIDPNSAYAGGNYYSGDRQNNFVHFGQILHHQGITSGTTHSVVVYTQGDKIFSVGPGQPGDSGGATWNNMGFVGVHSGNDHQRPFLRVTQMMN